MCSIYGNKESSDISRFMQRIERQIIDFVSGNIMEIVYYYGMEGPFFWEFKEMKKAFSLLKIAFDQIRLKRTLRKLLS